MSGVEDMVGAMEALLGTGEHNGDNVNKVTLWYGLPGEPWCDQGITYAAWHSGNAIAVTGGGKFAYTVAHANWFRSHGRYHTGISGIRRGDIVFFNWHDGGDSIDHVGIVTSVSGGAVDTVECNIENACRRKVRYSDVIAGYGRPDYTGGPVPPAGQTEPFPGEAWFHTSPSSPIITRMGAALVREGCGHYDVGPGPDWSEADRLSYAAYQRKLGYSGTSADGYPGKISWDKLKVSR